MSHPKPEELDSKTIQNKAENILNDPKTKELDRKNKIEQGRRYTEQSKDRRTRQEKQD